MPKINLYRVWRYGYFQRFLVFAFSRQEAMKIVMKREGHSIFLRAAKVWGKKGIIAEEKY